MGADLDAAAVELARLRLTRDELELASDLLADKVTACPAACRF